MSRHLHNKHPSKVPSPTQSTLDTAGKVVKPFKVTDFCPHLFFLLLTVILISFFNSLMQKKPIVPSLRLWFQIITHSLLARKHRFKSLLANCNRYTSLSMAQRLKPGWWKHKSEWNMLLSKSLAKTQSCLDDWYVDVAQQNGLYGHYVCVFG